MLLLSGFRRYLLPEYRSKLNPWSKVLRRFGERRCPPISPEKRNRSCPNELQPRLRLAAWLLQAYADDWLEVSGNTSSLYTSWLGRNRENGLCRQT
jgi:hypothetical protein